MNRQGTRIRGNGDNVSISSKYSQSRENSSSKYHQVHQRKKSEIYLSRENNQRVIVLPASRPPLQTINSRLNVPSIPQPKPYILHKNKQQNSQKELNIPARRLGPGQNHSAIPTFILAQNSSTIPAKRKKMSMQNLRNYEPFEEVKKQESECLKHQIKKLEYQQNTKLDDIKIKEENFQSIKDDAVPIKLVLVGDSYAGKTSMLLSYTKDEFSYEHTPTIFENYIADVRIGEKKIKLSLWDTAGQDQYQKIRFLSYKKTDVFLICFSMVDKDSFENALFKWLPEVQQECPQAFKIFVGTKNDIYTEEELDPKLKRHLLPVHEMKKKVGQINYELMICDSLTQNGLNKVFTFGMNEVLKKLEAKREKESLFFCQLI